MAISRKQIERVLANNIIPADAHLTLAQAYAEAYLRRKLYAWEDGAVIDMDKLFKAAWRQIVTANAVLSERLGVSNKLVSGMSGMQWRDGLYNAIVDASRYLLRDVSQLAMDRAITAYYAGQLGRAWGLHVSTIESAPKPRLSLVSTLTAQQRIRDEWQIRMGEAWDVSFAQPFLKFESAARNALTSALISDGETPTDGLRRIKALMGIDSLLKLYYQAQLNVRTAVMVSSNLGSLALYLDNRVVQEAVSGIGAVIVFVTMADGRVCPECRPYAGRMWRVDTIDGLIGAGLTLPYPPLHGGCRCSHVMLPLPEWLLPPDVPPGMTWADYLILEGFEGILDVFINRRALDSSQVGEEIYSDYYT